jgi:phage baseplate assembly protein W
MNGMNAATGKHLSNIDHLRQSIADILTTPLGSRVMLRDYGSRIFDLIDAPLNHSTIIDIYAAVAEALDEWETRIKLKKVELNEIDAGILTVDLTGVYLPDGQEIKLEGITIK